MKMESSYHEMMKNPYSKLMNKTLHPSHEDSGYSSDSSVASGSKSKSQSANNSSESLRHFPTPDTTWKYRLRYATSTPSISPIGKTPVFAPDITPIQGPFLRSKTQQSSESTPSIPAKLEFIRSKTQQSSESTQSIPGKLELERKEYHPLPRFYSCANINGKESKKEEKAARRYSLRSSPLKSPTKINKNKENLSISPPKNSDLKSPIKPKLNDKFSEIDLSNLSPRRVSPRLSNIVTRMMYYMPYMLPKVFSFLGDQDLLNASQTCHQFRAIVQYSSRLNDRKQKYVKAMKRHIRLIGKENAEKPLVPRPLRTSPRKALGAIQLSYHHKSPKKSPTKSTTRFERFFKEGQKLKPGEYQQKCVSCQEPACVTPAENRATCSNQMCGFIYCVNCLNEFHENASDCPALKPRPRFIPSVKIFSKNKKRLRRL